MKVLTPASSGSVCCAVAACLLVLAAACGSSSPSGPGGGAGGGTGGGSAGGTGGGSAGGTGGGSAGGAGGGSAGGAGGGSAGGAGGGSGGGAAAAYKTFAVGGLPLSNLAVDSAGRIWAISGYSSGTGQPPEAYLFNPTSQQTSGFGVAGSSSANGTQGNIVIDAAGEAWLTTSGSALHVTDENAVVELTPTGAVAGRYYNQGPANPDPCISDPCAQDPFDFPQYLAISASGDLWVTDSQYLAQGTFPGGAYLTQLGPGGSYSTSAHIPGGISAFVMDLVIDSSGRVWTVVAALQGDANSRDVVAFSSAGAVAGTYSLSAAAGAGVHMAVDTAGHIWIAYDANGTSSAGGLIALGASGAVLGSYAIAASIDPEGLAIDSNDHLWIVDDADAACTSNCMIGTCSLWELDASGNVLHSYPSLPGAASGATRDLVIDPAGNLWVASSAGGGATGQLIEAVGLAQGPEHFAVPGPQFPY